MDYWTTAEMAAKWGVSPRRVAVLCGQGRVSGAAKVGKTWLIPETAEKPADRRRRTRTWQQRLAAAERGFRVVLPGQQNATYTSLLNFSDDLDKPFQRWYRYKEGFSIDLVKHLIREYSRHPGGLILDPFAGSGSTLLAARQLGYDCAGFEVNPFSCFLAQCKLAHYPEAALDEFRTAYETVLEKAKAEPKPVPLPKLSISSKVFPPEIESYFLSVRGWIDALPLQHEAVRDLLLLGWLACLEPVSNYRKAGNGLKRRKYVHPRQLTVRDVSIQLLEEYQNICIDLLKNPGGQPGRLYQESCLELSRFLPAKSVTGAIFSPPYANCFDYTEIYKLELWFGGFVQDYADLKRLRRQSLHSHLNGDLGAAAEEKSALLSSLLAELEQKKLWDKKIPKMLALYYDDMFRVLDQLYAALEPQGFCCIVVGNSAYGGVVFPADLILADYARQIGFRVDKIEVDRYLITSSQQYASTKEAGNFLRESVVCLIKPKSSR